MTDDELAELRAYVAEARDNGDHDPIDTADAGGLLDRLDAAEAALAEVRARLRRYAPGTYAACACADCVELRRLLGEG